MRHWPYNLFFTGSIGVEVSGRPCLSSPIPSRPSRLVQSYDKMMNAPLSTQVLEGLRTCRWSGRNEIVETSKATYYLDGAQYVTTDTNGSHSPLFLSRSTVESIEQCKNWFVSATSKQKEPTGRILLFYSSYDREPDVLLRSLMVNVLILSGV